MAMKRPKSSIPKNGTTPKKSRLTQKASPAAPATSEHESVDFYKAHFETDLEDHVTLKLGQGADKTRTELKGATKEVFEGYSVTVNGTGARTHDTDVTDVRSISEFGLVPKVVENFEKKQKKPVSREQLELFQAIGRYMDVSCVSKRRDYLPLICLHIVNHMTRTRETIVKNNALLAKATASNTLTEEIIDSCRDQGLTRPRILYLAPMMKHAHAFVHQLAATVFAPGERHTLMNLSRFEEEFGDDGNVASANRPVDYQEVFSGNIGDNFRLGIQFAKKALKLYQKFDEADVLVASPLGLRMIIGEEGEKNREIDFLSSIEIVVVDWAHVISMQNWEHLQSIMQVLNGVPSALTVDISRVRNWATQNLGKFYRQTLIFSELNFTELQVLYAQSCSNYAGGVSIVENPKSLLENIEKPLTQEFHRFECERPEDQSDLRFEYFTRNILPHLDSGTMIFVPSYFDFIRLRNYFKKENLSFLQLHEYAKDKKVLRARNMFYKRYRKFIVMTERFHFYKRFVIKGVTSLVFYQLPTNPHFYHELINSSTAETRLDSRVIFSKFDVIRMQGIFGKPQTKQMIKADEKYHVLVSE
uniref:U3 small nucleolar RNA-associated protein 25 homolog n=1 Tax=Panagrellus redivivus TaxID=6233 RepID=A0A7E4V3T3_PANRE